MTLFVSKTDIGTCYTWIHGTDAVIRQDVMCFTLTDGGFFMVSTMKLYRLLSLCFTIIGPEKQMKIWNRPVHVQATVECLSGHLI